MTSLTKPKTLSKTEVKITAWQLSITFESPNSGHPTLNVTSSLTKSQSAWHLSKSHAYKSRQTTQTVTRTAAHTLRSLDRLHQLIGVTLTVIKSAPGVWCDYCKVRYGTNSILGQKAASYTVISNHPRSQGTRRHYCNSCAIEVQTWADGTVWSLPEQTEYLMKQEELPSV
jgi:hypothetical protein